MAYMPTIAGSKVAISISESPDMSVLGLSDAHLRDAMDRLALHLLSSGASLAYGGDLRAHGFTDLVVRTGTSLPARIERGSDWRDQLPRMAGPYK